MPVTPIPGPPTLRLLGGAVIESGETLLGGPAAQRHRLALLAILAVEARPVSRDKLVAYLWPERETEAARNLLKSALHAVRK
jgi:DNA-binding SARP family transcriptional activator